MAEIENNSGQNLQNLMDLKQRYVMFEKTQFDDQYGAIEEI
jgi:hypothetical protein